MFWTFSILISPLKKRFGGYRGIQQAKAVEAARINSITQEYIKPVWIITIKKLIARAAQKLCMMQKPNSVSSQCTQ